jgi:hypothetical protein
MDRQRTSLGTALRTTTLTTSGFANTRYGGLTGSPVFSSAAFAYQEAAWLTTQFAMYPGDYLSIPYAIWDIMNPDSEPTTYGDVSAWLTRAANFRGRFEIVTNLGLLALTGQQQEFLVQTPEPGSLSLLFCGVLALAVSSLLRTGAAA